MFTMTCMMYIKQNLLLNSKISFHLQAENIVNNVFPQKVIELDKIHKVSASQHCKWPVTMAMLKQSY